ncbi:AraC family transcriptional regulator [Sphingobium sp. SYK-6]|uniref:AraC-like ligand-binding domain-containing protein n=1 Tax=Sphingobium sp. (strain NBRC 103272 / SYK-6) TaxID=627192 RepID=UPI00022776DA|nr:helix-turn-helix domain-containing protein [Sphingobium sp. SYK-6]BAK66199.1 AraC family transcriptional regulator [Sphingobium sp. SYK-6]
MDLISTNGLPRADRGAAWAALYATRMSKCEFTPGDTDRFDAELRITQLGPVKIARHAMDRCSVERRRSDIVIGAPRLYNFLLQAEGTGTFYQCGKESELTPGDFVLCDTGLPHFFKTEGPAVNIMVRVPLKILSTYLPTPEQFCGQRLGRAAGLTGAAAAMVRELGSGQGPGCSPLDEERVARYLLEMISMSYTSGNAPLADASAIAWQRRRDVIQFIEDNLRDPDLSPALISARLRVSGRHLRTVFASGGEKILAYILRRRLEECARQMSNPAWSMHTLTEIAFSWGFNSSAHFTRTFHEKYSVAPREFRRRALERSVTKHS